MNNGTFLPRKMILLVSGGILGIILLLVGLNLLSYGWVRLSLPDDAPSAEVTITREGEELKKFTLVPGEPRKVFIKRGPIRIDTTAASRKGITVGEVHRLKTTDITVAVGRQLATDKLASATDQCPLLLGGVSFSYNCFGNGPIYRHEAIDPNKLEHRTAILDGQEYASPTAYQNGLLAFLNGEGPQLDQLVFINPLAEEVRPITLPGNIANPGDEQPEIVTSDDPAKPLLLLKYQNTNKLYYLSDINDPKATEIYLPAGFNMEKGDTDFSLQLTNEGLTLYIGPPIETDAVEHTFEEEPQVARGTGTIYRYGLDGRVKDTLTTPEDFVPIKVYSLPDDFYAASTRRGVAFFHESNRVLTKVHELFNTASPVIANNKVYFQTEGVAYEFAPGKNKTFSLASVFSSNAIEVSEIFATPSGILFTGFAERSDDPPRDAYQLLNRPQTERPFEEVLDFDKVKPYLLAYDFDDNTILCTVRVTSNADYFTLRDRVRAKLAELNIDLGGRTVELTSLN